MPRDLKRSDRNELVIIDDISGGQITLYYRQPTAEEYIGYNSAIAKRDGDKITFDEPLRMKYSLDVLTGVADGCLSVDGKPISTDPASEHFCADWKPLIQDTAADWLMILAAVVFDGTRRERPAVPFGKS